MKRITVFFGVCAAMVIVLLVAYVIVLKNKAEQRDRAMVMCANSILELNKQNNRWPKDISEFDDDMCSRMKDKGISFEASDGRVFVRGPVYGVFPQAETQTMFYCVYLEIDGTSSAYWLSFRKNCSYSIFGMKVDIPGYFFF